MTFEITFGWWILPTLISLYCIYRAFIKKGTGNSDIGSAIQLVLNLLWLIPGLLIWLIYLILKVYNII